MDEYICFVYGIELLSIDTIIADEMINITYCYYRVRKLMRWHIFVLPT